MTPHPTPEKDQGGAADSTAESAQNAAGPSPVQPLLKNLAALAEYLSYYLAVRADSLRLRLRRALVWTLVAATALLAASTALVVAVVLLLSGVANGLSALCGGHLWAGQLLAGFIVLFGAGLAIAILAARQIQASLRQTRDKYEQRQSKQRAEFGEDVAERARSRRSHV
jgi:ABC-type multidrug transport system fused ATPase/permease subunit